MHPDARGARDPSLGRRRRGSRRRQPSLVVAGASGDEVQVEHPTHAYLILHSALHSALHGTLHSVLHSALHGALHGALHSALREVQVDHFTHAHLVSGWKEGWG